MSARESKWERRADAVLGIAASTILFLMMLLTFVDVVARYLFNFRCAAGSKSPS
jgi:TRAP-type C4-dicarboxylate transport system permease small subunit